MMLTGYVIIIVCYCSMYD